MSTTYDDPNREAVGLPPIWGAGEPEPEPQTKRRTSKADKAADEDESTEGD